MGNFRYCSACERGLPAPWQGDFSTEEIVMNALSEDASLECIHCGNYGEYEKEDFIQALATKLTELEEKQNV